MNPMIQNINQRQSFVAQRKGLETIREDRHGRPVKYPLQSLPSTHRQGGLLDARRNQQRSPANPTKEYINAPWMLQMRETGAARTRAKHMCLIISRAWFEMSDEFVDGSITYRRKFSEAWEHSVIVEPAPCRAVSTSF